MEISGVTKYRPQHEIVKELKLKGSIAQIADSMIDHLGKLIDSMDAKDYIYLACFLAATYLAYQVLTGTSLLLSYEALEASVKQWATGKGGLPIGTIGKFTWTNLAISMVAAYMILNLNIGDIAKAVALAKGGIE
jgi:quinol-cytochrome oxidoreductase complex cytochrome b subunit